MTRESLARLENAYLQAHNRLMLAKPEVLAKLPSVCVAEAIAVLAELKERVEALSDE